MEGNSLKISADVILNEYNCLVCFSQVEDCYITKCGHLFCKKCIDESVNRFHKCPYCQSELKDIDIFRDFALNNLRKIILEERSKAERSYMDSLTKSLDSKDLLEQVFVNGLKDMIMTYRAYLTQNQDRFTVMKDKLLAEHKQRVEISKVDKLMLDQALDQEMKRLEDDFVLVRDYTVESLKNSLKSVVPEPKMLDVRSSLIIPQKNAVIPNVYIHPSSKVVTLKTDIEEHFLRAGNPIQNIDPRQMFLIFVPPEKKLIHHRLLNEGSKLTSQSDLRTYLDRIESQGFVTRSLASDDFFIKHDLRQNGAIYVYGVFILKDEAQPECLTHKYQVGKVSSYFSCNECGFNWICGACADYCHKGHTLMPFVQDQSTTWACCYCTTKGSCKPSQKILIVAPDNYYNMPSGSHLSSNSFQ